MIIHDFRCVNGHVEEHFVTSDQTTAICACGEKSVRVILSAAKLDYGSMAMGESAGTTAIDRFEKMHKDQRAKEERFNKEHGVPWDRAPGS